MNLALSRELFAEALVLFRQLDDPLGVGWCLEWTADFAGDVDGRWADAEVLHTEVVELGRTTGVDHAVGDALIELARLAARAGDRWRAIVLANEAVAHYRRAHDRWQLCGALKPLALALDAAGNHQDAAIALGEALDLADECGFDDHLVWTLRNIAMVLPEELKDVARKLWTPPPDWAPVHWWPEPTWDDRCRWLDAQCEVSGPASSRALRATIPLAREALARMDGGPTEQDSYAHC
jgi:hypothetical protein